MLRFAFFLCPAITLLALVALPAEAQNAKQKKPADKAAYPPKLPDGKEVVTDTSEDFLKALAGLREGVTVAKTPPTVDFLYFPGQTYEGHPWSNWGDSVAANGKYYASIGDHLAPQGNAFVYEYDPATKKFRLLADVRKILGLPDGHYTPGKIHGRLDIGDDGCIYFSTHRGSTKVTTDAYHYKGDWIIRVNVADGKAEVVAQGPVPKHCIPCSVLDPRRLIFYGGTAQGSGAEDEGIQFFAYDVQNKKVLYSGDNGPSRYMIFAKSTGRIYFNPGKDTSTLMRWDPEKKTAPEKIPGAIGIRTATQETPLGIVYTASQGQAGRESMLYAFDTKTEKGEELGPLAVAKQQYVASLDADPTGRFLYYIAGAHGHSDADGTPVVQFDTKTKRKKVIAFLHPFYKDKYGVTLTGTYSTAIDEKGEKLYVTWNANRASKNWDTAALTVIHIPASER
ncbi:hypothetical protein AYO44_10105 [Planctomycetaceae bacterium SCGC AG-212-F19]|nr:hypothetical protein AYO44_10105 [Planctomycetaceae bacterium SCGC AG-212-F19]